MDALYIYMYLYRYSVHVNEKSLSLQNSQTRKFVFITEEFGTAKVIRYMYMYYWLSSPPKRTHVDFSCIFTL